MANSGGGVIVIGLESDGSLAPTTPLAALNLDQATVTDKVLKYTSVNISGLSIWRSSKDGQQVIAIEIAGSPLPIPFSSPGTYALPDSKQKTVFGLGTVYFRHGSKSEPAMADDLRRSFDRALTTRREEWLGNIRRVVEAPEGSVVSVLPGAIAPPGSDEAAVKVRLVHDPGAQEVPHWNPDDTHPFRQKELVAALNERLATRPKLNSYDVQCVRRAHAVDANPNFSHCPKYGTRQFSNAFLDWLVDNYTHDANFFHDARERVRSHV